MIGDLDEFQMERLLLSGTLGHLGCHADGKTYVIPIAYLYHEGKIISYTKDGLKTDMMRKNPDVCIQVEEIRDAANWQSVIVWGKYRELEGIEADDAIQLLQRRLHPYAQSSTTPPTHGLDKAYSGVKPYITTIAFTIDIDEMTGRFERESMS
jgi:nitroimidazol reductase NimA-like FMN-containing flavoprotein (pyridoxamine 5'-phosphate oxidase superfamily)